MNNGLDEEEIEGMECLLEQMKDRTIMLRRKKHNIQQHIVLNGGRFDDEGEETILLHDDLLLPHWKEFANALQLYHNSSRLLNLSIRNVQLLSSVMGLLTKALGRKTIFKTFDLSNNEFVNTREGIEFAVDIARDNPNLDLFQWAHNPIERMEDARYMIDAIISHPCIGRILLENCFGEDINDYEMLRSLFTSGKSFSHIDLEGNDIRTGGGTEISDYLATNPSLKELNLANNHLNDGDAILIARALKQNNNLKYLHLVGNDLTEKGENALSNAIYDSTSLNSLADCNHTCKIDVVDFGDIPENEPGITPKVNKARKIYHLLSTRNGERINVHHFNLEFDNDDGDDSLVLVPQILDSVKHYSRVRRMNHVPCLSIMYEILRSWKMPELYENRVGTATT